MDADSQSLEGRCGGLGRVRFDHQIVVARRPPILADEPEANETRTLSKQQF